MVNKEKMMFPFISPKHEGVARIQWIKWLLLWNDWAVMRLLCEIVGQNIFASYLRWNGEICQKSAFAKLQSMQSLLVYCFQSKSSWITNVSILLHHEVIPFDESELTLLIFTNRWSSCDYVLFYDFVVTWHVSYYHTTMIWMKKTIVSQSFSNIINTWKLFHCYK